MLNVMRSIGIWAVLASNAFAAIWTPTVGAEKNPAPAGDYVGKVTREADGDKVVWKITTPTGVLTVRKGKDEISPAEEETLNLAVAQNDDNNKVVIDKSGNVDSVSTG